MNDMYSVIDWRSSEAADAKHLIALFIARNILMSLHYSIPRPMQRLVKNSIARSSFYILLRHDGRPRQCVDRRAIC